MAGIAGVGAGVTYMRYQDLPREPLLARKDVSLAVEIRMLPGMAANSVPTGGRMGSGPRDAAVLEIVARGVGQSEGRLVVAGRIALRQAVSPRLLEVQFATQGSVNFMLPLAAVPGEADTAWTGGQTAANDRDHQIRYRVRFGGAG